MKNLEQYFIDAQNKKTAKQKKQEGKNKECFAFTKQCSETFLNKFDFLKNYGFTIRICSQRSLDERCNYYLEECFIVIRNNDKNYSASVKFPMEGIKNEEYDFCSYNLECIGPMMPKGFQTYTYQEAAMTLATLFD